MTTVTLHILAVCCSAVSTSGSRQVQLAAPEADAALDLRDDFWGEMDIEVEKAAGNIGAVPESETITLPTQQVSQSVLRRKPRYVATDSADVEASSSTEAPSPSLLATAANLEYRQATRVEEEVHRRGNDATEDIKQDVAEHFLDNMQGQINALRGQFRDLPPRANAAGGALQDAIPRARSRIIPMRAPSWPFLLRTPQTVGTQLLSVLANKTDYGDLTCMRWTGGTCGFSSCSADRGLTECIEGKCFCTSGQCSDMHGVCQPEHEGEWLGRHAIRFLQAYDEDQPYISTTTETISDDESWTEAKCDVLAAVGNSSKEWKIALTPGGFVRLESAAKPGNVITIYNNRRRRTEDEDFFLQAGSSPESNGSMAPSVAASASPANNSSENESSDPGDASSDADLWPMLMNVETASPLAVSFQVRKVAGGLELWNPAHGVSLASAEKSTSWLDDGDPVTPHGVGECYPAGLLSNGCGNRELLRFEPELPESVVTTGDRKEVETVGGLRWWQIALIGFGCICLCFCILGMCSADDQQVLDDQHSSDRRPDDQS